MTGTRPFRVLVLHPGPLDEGGAWRRTARLVSRLLERGIAVDLFAAGAGSPTAFADFRTFFFPLPPAAQNLEAFAQGLLAQGNETYRGFTPGELAVLLRFQVMKDNPRFLEALDPLVAGADAVLLDAPFWAALAAPLAGKYGRPLFIEAGPALHRVHATNPRSQKLLLVKEIEAHRAARRVFFESDEDREAFAAHAVSGETGSCEEALIALALSPPPPAAGRGLCLIDNNLKNIYGHHFNYAKSIADEAGKAGVPFRALVAADAAEEIPRGLGSGCVPAFRHGLHAPFFHPAPETPPGAYLLYDFTLGNIEFHNDLVKALPAAANAGDLLFMANVDHHHLLAWGVDRLRVGARPLSEVVLMLRYTYIKPSGRPENDGLGVDRPRRSPPTPSRAWSRRRGAGRSAWSPTATASPPSSAS